MLSRYRNQMLEELLEEENVSESESKQKDFSGKVVHCSQFQARNYLYQSGFRGIANNQKMQRLFRFALCAYDHGMFAGCSMVFLDILSPVVAFAVVSCKDVGIGSRILEKTEKICEIMGFEVLKLTNTGYSKEFIRLLDIEREEDLRYSEGKGCYVRKFYQN